MIKAQAFAEIATRFDRADVYGRARSRIEADENRPRFREALAGQTPATDDRSSTGVNNPKAPTEGDDDIVAAVAAALSRANDLPADEVMPRLTAALERLLARPEPAAGQENRTRLQASSDGSAEIAYSIRGNADGRSGFSARLPEFQLKVAADATIGPPAPIIEPDAVDVDAVGKTEARPVAQAGEIAAVSEADRPTIWPGNPGSSDHRHAAVESSVDRRQTAIAAPLTLRSDSKEIFHPETAPLPVDPVLPQAQPDAVVFKPNVATLGSADATGDLLVRPATPPAILKAEANQTDIVPLSAPAVDPHPDRATIGANPPPQASTAEAEPAPISEADAEADRTEQALPDSPPAAEGDPDPELSDAIILPFAALAYAPVAAIPRKGDTRQATTVDAPRWAPIDIKPGDGGVDRTSARMPVQPHRAEAGETRSPRDDAPKATPREDAAEVEPLRASASSTAHPTVAVIERPAGVLPAISPASLSLIAGIAAHPAPVAPPAIHTDTTASAAPATSLKIQLHPVELGVVTATLRIEDGQLAIEIEVENPEALARLASDRESIERALRSIGLDVGDLRIQQAQPSTAQNQAGGQQNGQRDGQGGFAQNQNATGQSAGQNASGQNGSGGGRPGFADTVQGETHATPRNGAGGAADRGGVYI